MAFHEFSCNISPGCFWRAEIRIYSSAAALRKTIGPSFIEGEVKAYCECETKDDRLVTLHFSPESLSPGIVAHEVFHAVMELVQVLKLNMLDEYSQELAAHAVTHLVQKVNEAAKASRK